MTPKEAREFAHKLMRTFGQLNYGGQKFFDEDVWTEFMSIPKVQDRLASIKIHTRPIHDLMRDGDMLGAQALIISLILGGSNDQT